ncbi:hypothetical protein, partial [Brevibacillus reuszeri]|uniref:hypothetical protein n=1 Tax=Brevibacillus reuszeri TaxID=54915 RepID=UPI00289886BD
EFWSAWKLSAKTRSLLLEEASIEVFLLIFIRTNLLGFDYDEKARGSPTAGQTFLFRSVMITKSHLTSRDYR